MTQNKAIVDKLLTNVSNQYKPTGYISEQILPTINVVQTSGKLAGYGNDHIRISTQVHSGDGPYPRVKVDNRSTRSYVLEKHALSHVITEEDFANVEAPFDAEVDATDFLTNRLWIEKENGLAITLTTTANYATANTVTLSGTDQYSDLANSSPLEDSVTAHAAILDSTGAAPNTVIMSRKTFNFMRIHPDILGSLGYKDNRPGGLEMGELARSLGVERVLIGDVMGNTAKEGQADVLAPIWGKDVIYAVTPGTAAKYQVSLGYRIQKTQPRRVFKNAINNPPNSKEILVDDWYQQLISGIDGSGDIIAGYLIKDAIA
jgi:hypothetical protein